MLRQSITAICATCGQPFTRKSDTTGRYCSTDCYFTMQRRKSVASARARLSAKLDHNGPIPAHRPELGPCWPWMGTRNEHGYGVIMRGGRRVYTHRLSYEFAYGPLPPGQYACHHCDYPPCGRPDHLFAGTDAVNLADMRAKGRGGKPPSPAGRIASPTTRARMAAANRQRATERPETFRRGDTHAAAKLTAELVRTARLERMTGIPIHVLATRYGVTYNAMWSLLRRLTWAHVT